MKKKILYLSIISMLFFIIIAMKNSVIAMSNEKFDYTVKIPNGYKVINSSYTDYYEMETYDCDNSDTFFRITVYDKQFFKDFPNGNMWFSSWVNINKEEMKGFSQFFLDKDSQIIEKSNSGYKITKKQLLKLNEYPARRIIAVGPAGYTVDVYQVLTNNYFVEFYFFSENESAAKNFTDSKIQKSIINSFKINNDSASNCENIVFKDVVPSEWYCDSVKYVYKNKIMSGYNSTTFAPNDKLTRGMVVTILYKMEGCPAVSGNSKFNDVKSTEYYAKAIKWATDKGIVHGYGGTNKFGPDDNILRQDLAGILWNYANYKKKNVNVTANLTKFKDYKKIDNYANKSMQWAVGKGVITGNADGTLNPKGNATRAEAAAMIVKYCNKIGR